MKRSRKVITVQNPNGVHSRVATQLVQIARTYEVRLLINDSDDLVDCSSIMEVLSRAYTCGSRLAVEAEGVQPEKALLAVDYLLSRTCD